MTTEETNIISRFFAAIERLKEDKALRGLQTFTTRYGLNRRNLQSMRSAPERLGGAFRASWLTYLANDYGVSPEWLLVGRGAFYTSPPESAPPRTKNCKIIARKTSASVTS